jgi:cation:H+ antiporter
MVLTLATLTAGLVALFVGGEVLVRGSVALASRLGISPLVIGLTIVGFGTSTPELLVSLNAALKGSPDIAVGNIVGSNIANILLILGVSAVIMPFAARFADLSRDLTVMILASLALLALGYWGTVDRLSGTIMFLCLAGYIAYLFRFGSSSSETPVVGGKPQVWTMIVACLAGGLAALVLGADWLVDSSTTIARQFGISEAVIGLTVVAVGTSLPELATSVIAAFRRQADVAIGNVVGSNIFNILGILGITAIVQPVNISQHMASVDIPVMVAVGLVLVLMVVLLKRVSRLVGCAFIAAYTVYVALLF